MSDRQQESNKFSQLFARVELVKVKLDLTWDELAEKMECHRSLFFQVKRGNCGFSDRNLYKLEQLEVEAGLRSESSPLNLYPTVEGIAESLHDGRAETFDRVLSELQEIGDRVKELQELVRKLKKGY